MFLEKMLYMHSVYEGRSVFTLLNHLFLFLNSIFLSLMNICLNDAVSWSVLLFRIWSLCV